MKTALAITDFEGVKLSLTAEFHVVKAQVLERAKAVPPVTDKASLELATETEAEIKRILSVLEKSRESVKAPVIKLGREIDGIAKAAGLELEQQKTRLHADALDYYREEERKAEATRRAAEKLAAAKRAKEEAEARDAQAEQRLLEEQAAQAKNAEEAARLQAEAETRRQQAAEAAKRAEEVKAREVKAPFKAEGMSVRKVWKHQVLDMAALYAVRPDLVTLEPKTNEINRAVRVEGMRECAGLRIYEETDTTVRL